MISAPRYFMCRLLVSTLAAEMSTGLLISRKVFTLRFKLCPV